MKKKLVIELTWEEMKDLWEALDEEFLSKIPQDLGDRIIDSAYASFGDELSEW